MNHPNPSRISDILETRRAEGRPVFSFEFFPPKNADGKAKLRETIDALRPLGPDFCSITYGAGGSTRELTLELVAELAASSTITPMAHLTCVGATADELRQVVGRLRAANVHNLLALRGDPPHGQSQFVAAEGGFRHASDLMRLVRDEFGLCVGGAVYPEGHTENRDPDINTQHTRQKALSGADFFITQVFFDPAMYFAFVARLRAAGVYTPVLPGVMPITDVGQLERFVALCGASIPPLLRDQLEAARHDPVATMQLGIAYATHQCVRLLEGGAPGIHFYTLNRSPSTRAILAALRARYA